jgi:DNA end-binding protein Ku
VIDLVQFTDDSAIDPVYVDRAYYLAPDGKMAADAFAVMRDGMKGARLVSGRPVNGPMTPCCARRRADM